MPGMNNGNPNDNDKGPKPPRVPLLEDVITPGDATNKPARKNGHSLAPDKEPAPSAARDAAIDKSVEKEAAPPSVENDGNPPVEHSPPSPTVKDGVSRAVKLDPYIREWLLENAKSLTGNDARGLDRETVLRAGANLMVENLVKEYSQEIVERLRKELTSLLEELDVDKEEPGND